MDAVLIRPGFRRPFALTPVPAGAKLEDPTITIDAGNSTASIEATPDGGAKGFLNGDGDLGPKSATISFDGRLGPDIVTVNIPVEWTVATPDATGATVSVGDEEPLP